MQSIAISDDVVRLVKREHATLQEEVMPHIQVITRVWEREGRDEVAVHFCNSHRVARQHDPSRLPVADRYDFDACWHSSASRGRTAFLAHPG